MTAPEPRAAAHTQATGYLDYALNAARDLANDLDLTRDLAHALDRVRPIMLELNSDLRDRDCADAIGHALDRAPGQILDLDLDRVLDRDLVRNLVRNLVGARDRARDLTRNFDLARVFDRDLVRDLVRDLDLASSCAVEIVARLEDPALQSLVGATEELRAVEPVVAGLARWLVGRVARVLPVTDRHRWAEEWRAELWDLAEAQTGRARQVGYALRLLTRAWGLRVELREPRRRGAPS